MSLLRKTGCYQTKVRLFRTLPREDTIRWFILPDGSPLFPGLHLFGGRPWRLNRGVPIQGPGEFADTRLIWDRGLPPVGPLEFRGEMDWFLHGIPDNLAPP
jgi:hypothetical protein